MISRWFDVGDWFRLALPLGAFALIYWSIARRGSPRRAASIADDWPDEPYSVYTRKFDLTLQAREVPDALAAQSPDGVNGWALRDPALWRAKIAAAREIRARLAKEEAGGSLEGLGDHALLDWAICLLIDQSGSMRDDPILQTAATVKWLSDRLGALAVPVALLGFSTVGWKGGLPYQNWRLLRRPARPGRLCALLHIVYQNFDEPLADQDWEAMLHPDVLRENVDGEAVEWAIGLLKGRPEPYKLLIVISDGAPVDDATLLHGGAGILERHLLKVIAETEAENVVTLGAVGVGYEVSRYYRRSRAAKVLADLPAALSGLIAEIVSEVRKPA